MQYPIPLFSTSTPRNSGMAETSWHGTSNFSNVSDAGMAFLDDNDSVDDSEDEPVSKKCKTERQEVDCKDREEADNRRVVEIVVQNICATINRLSSGVRRPSRDERVLVAALSVSMMSPAIKVERLSSAMTRVFGISVYQQNNALELLEQQRKENKPQCNAVAVSRKPARTGRFASLRPILDSIVKYFHEDSPLVEIDRSRPDPYQGRYSFKVAGRIAQITCRRRLLKGTKEDLVRELKSSPFYHSIVKKIGRNINDKKLQSCICFCMKQKQISECACSVCTEFKILLECWHSQRRGWHSRTPCRCSGCSSTKKKDYFDCSRSVATFFEVLLCAKQAYPHLRLPHFPSDESSSTPYFRSWFNFFVHEVAVVVLQCEKF